MKKLLIFTLILSSFFLFTVNLSLANEHDEANTNEPAMEETTVEELPEPGILPDSPLYVFKRIKEVLGDWFTFDKAKKAQRFLDHAEKRLAEAKALENNKNFEKIKNTLEKYDKYIEKANKLAEKFKGKDNEKLEEILQRIEMATIKHKAVLEKAYEQVAPPAKNAILKALENSQKGLNKALELREKFKDRLKNVDKERIKADILEGKRILNMKLQEISNLTGIKAPNRNSD